MSVGKYSFVTPTLHIISKLEKNLRQPRATYVERKRCFLSFPTNEVVITNLESEDRLPNYTFFFALASETREFGGASSRQFYLSLGLLCLLAAHPLLLTLHSTTSPGSKQFWSFISSQTRCRQLHVLRSLSFFFFEK